MRDNLSWLKDYPIGQILSMPGSHDAGMYKVNSNTSRANAEGLLTQTNHVLDQLKFGARWFDIRAYAVGNEFYCGNFAHAGAYGWHGGTGEYIFDVIDDVNRFTRDNKELIILRITPLANADGGSPLSTSQQVSLIKLLYERLNYVRKVTNSDVDYVERVHEQSLDKYVGTNECVVLDLQITDEVRKAIGRPLTRYYQEVISCCYIQDTLNALISSNTGKIFLPDSMTQNASVLGGTEILQNAVFPGQPQVLATGAADAPAGYQMYGHVFQTDNIKNDAQYNMCLAASRMNWQTGQSGAQRLQYIVTYGGKLYTDPVTLNRIDDLYRQGKPIKVENSLFSGEDPWFGHRKSCTIYVSDVRPANQGDGLFWRGFFGREGDEIETSYRITSMYWHNDYLKGQKFRAAYAVLNQTRLAEIPFRITLEYMPYLKPDPSKGTKKNLNVRYKSLTSTSEKDRRIYEDRTYYLKKDIDWIRYHDAYLPQPEWYAQFFDRIDGESMAPIVVGNYLFDGWDPAFGKKKELTMSLRKGPGTDREESQTEGKSWNVAYLL